MRPLIEALTALGVECRQDQQGTTVVGGTLTGDLTSLPGDISSQYVSALLLLAPMTRRGLTIHLTTPLESRPYVEMTIECLKQFDIIVVPDSQFRTFTVAPQIYRPTTYVVEGDWSSASYLLAAGALGGVVVVDNVRVDSLQGDKQIATLLREMGASVVADETSLTVRQSKLRAIKADVTDCIDLLPTLAVLSALAEGQSELTGIRRARLKESDRVASVIQELGKAGVAVVEEQDRLLITGTRPKGSVFDSHGDHRIAMAFALLGIAAGNTVIEGAHCVAKTYPDFWEVLAEMGVQISKHE
jgi:3-phosphoshikimate 1-carboxyvinyltransferase